jgi:hypothetical protein
MNSLSIISPFAFYIDDNREIEYAYVGFEDYEREVLKLLFANGHVGRIEDNSVDIKTDNYSATFSLPISFGLIIIISSVLLFISSLFLKR